jgi:hypothetical protein
VRLKRDSTGRWQMFSRNGKKYQPPTSFLKKLKTDFPAGVEMEAELVVNTDQRCTDADLHDAKKRIGPRTMQFKQMHFSSLTSTKNLSAWNGLNLVVFSFPQLNKTFKESWTECKAILKQSLDQHPHITACSYQAIKDTAQAIRNFKSVVQLGCEGIVLRDPQAVYTTSIDENAPRIYKMKQKIVTTEKQVFKASSAAEWNRYKRKTEIQYTVPEFQAKNTDGKKRCTFQQTNIGLAPDPNGHFHEFLKFHESAEGKMNVWDLNEIGNRHTCVATKYDLTFEVQPLTILEQIEEATAVYDRISIQGSQPFEFIVETVYVFLHFEMYQVANNRQIKIGMLRFSGKTGQEAKAECFHHKKYSFPRRFQNLDEQERDLLHTLMGFLQHTPHDNKKFVLVMNTADALNEFKKYTDSLTKTNENKVFIDTARRLENNNTSRKQQVEVIFMTKVVKTKKLVEPIIPWNSDGTAGRIPENATNHKTLSALVDPRLSEEEFSYMCRNQYRDYVKLQNLWNMIDENGESIPVDDHILKKLALPKKPPEWDKKTICLSLAGDMEPSSHNTVTGVRTAFYEFLQTLGSDYLRNIKCIYTMLSEYDKQTNNTGIITLDDFTETFRRSRNRELSCPPDPEVNPRESNALSKFPYQNGTDINSWHCAWRMSFAFFKDKGICVSANAPDSFQYTGPDLFTRKEEDPLSPPAKRSRTDESTSVHIDLTNELLLARLKMWTL